jgi:hypothetical protein
MSEARYSSGKFSVAAPAADKRSAGSAGDPVEEMPRLISAGGKNGAD